MDGQPARCAEGGTRCSRQMIALEFDGVCLRYGSHVTLADGSFHIDQGQFIGLLGPNGAGKTTLFKAVLGLLRPSSGTINVFGRRTRRGNAHIGYVPQFGKQLNELNLSGLDLLIGSVTGSRYGWPFCTATERQDIDRVLEITGAGDLARLPMGTLSGGERQRILIAQALLGSPRMLLLDEPLVSLDPSRQESVVNLVRRIQQDLGITVLFCSHELTPLLGKIDGVLYLGRQKVALGSVESVVTAKVLSDLYGAPMDVVRSEGRVFVVAGNPSSAP